MYDIEMVTLDIDNSPEPTTSGPSSSNDEATSNIKRRSPTISPDPYRGYDSDTTNDHDRSLLSNRRTTGQNRRSSVRKKYPPEWYKTFVMLLYAICCLIAMTFIETIVHDRVPDQNSTEPLQDVAWTVTEHIFGKQAEHGIHACFKATEIIGLVLMGLTLVHIITHSHSSIVLRRFFFHFGTVYLYRVATIYVTILPVPKLAPGHCMPPTDGSLKQLFERSFGTLAGGGMDMTGKNMCGDYMYSGHTCVLTSTCLFILEYSPKRWWIYHYLVQFAAITGVICILIAHEHYTIDVLVAYYVCTHHFWSYHTLASSQDLKNAPVEKVHLTRTWWHRIFVFMEGNINPIPRTHQNPVTKIKRIIERLRNRSSASVSYNHL